MTPYQIQNAYGINQIWFSGGKVMGNGAWQTIAIVTAYNDPNISKDLMAFDKAFGLPNPSFTVRNLGGTTTNAGWALETALDVEWAHAIAPGAKILLVEAPSDGLSDLFNAVSVAEHSGASVVSMSWGTTEFPGEQSYNALFNTPGVTFVAASGDSGAWHGPMYPSASPNVLAVGGTSLALSGNSYSSESGWNGSTGGFSGYDTNWSSYQAQPSYQTAALQAVGLGYGVRTTPDVSFNADPNSGVPVYDSVPYSGQSGWFQVGGTSAAAPAWAGLIAITNQGLSLARPGQTLSGTQAITDLYALPGSYFHDITSGFNAYLATPGYDLVTGLGSPHANLVVAGLLYLNGASGAYASAQLGVATTPSIAGVTASRSDLTPTQTGGTVSSGGSTVTVGLPGTGSTLSLVSSLSGSSTLTSGTSILAFAPQTPATQAQPTIVQATTVHVEQTSSPSTAPGQSLVHDDGISSRSLEIDPPSEPRGLTDEVSAAPAPAPLPVEEAAPAPLDESEAPASEAPSPAREVPARETPVPEAPAPDAEPAPPVDLPSVSVDSFDLALAQLNVSCDNEPRGARSAAWPVVDRAWDASASWKAPVLAGTAAIAAAGYRLVLSRPDRIRKRWTTGRFE